MDRYQIMSLLTRLESQHSDPYIISMMYAETLANIADRLTIDELRRLLVVGAFIHNNLHKSGEEDAIRK